MTESQWMLRTAVVLLGLTAAGGLWIAGLRFAGRPRPPHWLAMLHGMAAGSGLTLIVYAAFTTGVPPVVWAGLAVLVLAALGGVWMNLAFHMKERPLPVGILVGHGLAAAAGLALVAAAAW